MTVKNHSIRDDHITAAVEAGKTFFALPEASKMDVRLLVFNVEGPMSSSFRFYKLDIHKSSSFKGYTALLGENTDLNGKGDLHEGFDCGWEELDQNGTTSTGREDGAMSGSNVWPEIPGFRETVLAY